MRTLSFLALLAVAVVIGSQQATDLAAVAVAIPFGIIAALLWATRRPSFDVYQIETVYPDLVLLPPIEAGQ